MAGVLTHTLAAAGGGGGGSDGSGVQQVRLLLQERLQVLLHLGARQVLGGRHRAQQRAVARRKRRARLAASHQGRQLLTEQLGVGHLCELNNVSAGARAWPV